MKRLKWDIQGKSEKANGGRGVTWGLKVGAKNRSRSRINKKKAAR